MSRFPFAKTEKAEQHCQRVKEALIRFCGKTDHDAERLVIEYWSDQSDIEADELLYHEPPYYYAMCIAHHPKIGDNKPDWHKDSALWPPPDGWKTS
jgi:hypothetical protein